MEKKREYKPIQIKANASSIYEDGALLPLTVEDVCNNEVAIKQLINQHNLSQTQLSEVEDELSSIKSENDFLKTGPFIGIITAIINVCATIILGIAVNKLTTNPTDKSNELLLWFSGGILVTSYIANILYPYIKSWFSRSNK